jgi:hypothetical protein
MTNFTVLDKNIHRNTRVITDRGAEYGENIHLVPVIGDELTQLILEYPVCLIKSNDTGQFGLQALLGFEPEENLYLNGRQWNANYLPLHMRRQPFMVSIKGGTGQAPSPENSVITINTNNPRVQEEHGELLFNESGNSTPFLNEMNKMLSSLVNGIVRTEAFIKVLAEFDLIEPVHLDISFTNEETKRFEGIYTINEEKLKQIDLDKLNSLHKQGYLQACYLLLASMGNVQKLIQLKRLRLNEQT